MRLQAPSLLWGEQQNGGLRNKADKTVTQRENKLSRGLKGGCGLVQLFLMAPHWGGGVAIFNSLHHPFSASQRPAFSRPLAVTCGDLYSRPCLGLLHLGAMVGGGALVDGQFT